MGVGSGSHGEVEALSCRKATWAWKKLGASGLVASVRIRASDGVNSGRNHVGIGASKLACTEPAATVDGDLSCD